MNNVLYVEDCIVPIFSVPKADDTKIRFLGSGFYIGNEGYLLTCKHVIDSVEKDENLFTYQLGKKRMLELTVIRNQEDMTSHFARVCRLICRPLGILLMRHT